MFYSFFTGCIECVFPAIMNKATYALFLYQCQVTYSRLFFWTGVCHNWLKVVYEVVVLWFTLTAPVTPEPVTSSVTAGSGVHTTAIGTALAWRCLICHGCPRYEVTLLCFCQAGLCQWERALFFTHFLFLFASRIASSFETSAVTWPHKGRDGNLTETCMQHTNVWRQLLRNWFVHLQFSPRSLMPSLDLLWGKSYKTSLRWERQDHTDEHH